MPRLHPRIAVLVALVLAVTAPAAPAARPGEPAPAVELPTDGGRVALAELRGKVVLLDFWASWCGPCKLSFPWMSRMQDRHGARGLRVVAVNLDRQPADAAAFLRAVQPAMSAPLTIAWDSAGATPARYGVKAMPTSALIGADGRVQLQHAGFREDDKAALEVAIEAAIEAAGEAAGEATMPAAAPATRPGPAPR